MPHPQVDVVIASRGDREVFLREAVTSVLGQDAQTRIDVVVVYDRDEPPERPVAVIDEGQRRVRWILNDEHHGLAAARNAGVAATSAPWVAFLDDDDLWKQGKLSAQLDVVDLHPGVPLVGTGIEVLDSSGCRNLRPGPSDWITHRDLLLDRVTELHPSSFLVARHAFEKIGGVDTELPGGYAEDYDFLLRISCLGQIAMVVEPLTVVRWTGESYFVSRWNMISQALSVLLQKHPDFQGAPHGWARIKGQIAFAEAAQGCRLSSFRATAATLRRNPLEPRAYLAVLVAMGIVKPETVQLQLHKRGRGI